MTILLMSINTMTCVMTNDLLMTIEMTNNINDNIND